MYQAEDKMCLRCDNLYICCIAAHWWALIHHQQNLNRYPIRQYRNLMIMRNKKTKETLFDIWYKTKKEYLTKRYIEIQKT